MDTKTCLEYFYDTAWLPKKCGCRHQGGFGCAFDAPDKAGIGRTPKCAPGGVENLTPTRSIACLTVLIRPSVARAQGRHEEGTAMDAQGMAGKKADPMVKALIDAFNKS
jgi:hypothetical protein